MDEGSRAGPVCYDRIAVVGAGAWGTALAHAAAAAGRSVTLYARDAAVAESISGRRINPRVPDGLAIHEGVRATGDLGECAGADAVLLVVPAQQTRHMLVRLDELELGTVPMVLCSKGIELGSGRLLTEVLAEVAPGFQPAVLSGPSFARDVSLGLPTAISVAAAMPVARRLQASLARPAFRPYASDDLIGVALGGAAKNVYAIACGIVEGTGLGESARAAVVARGFSELLRLNVRLGGRAETLMGLAGLGDLVLTATSRSSRNFSLGYALAADRGAVGDGSGHLAEGAATATAIVQRAEAEGIELPLAQAVRDVLSGTIGIRAAIELLLNRPPRDE